jgi:ribosomal-protein-alanine N-acetyltransferase
VITRPSLRTSRAHLRLPEPDDASMLLAYRQQNRVHLAPWEPLREESHYTLESCVRFIGDANEKASRDRAYPLLAFDAHDSRTVATLTFANIVRGAFHACHIGYSVSADWQGRGLMHEILEAGIAWAFDGLGLHRVMANYVPRNERSARLLERLGFEREGVARAYLDIAGQWEDHILTAKVDDSDRVDIDSGS